MLRHHANRCHGRPNGVTSYPQCSWAALSHPCKPQYKLSSRTTTGCTCINGGTLTQPHRQVHGTVRASGCMLRPHANRCHGRPNGVTSYPQCSWAALSHPCKPQYKLSSRSITGCTRISSASLSNSHIVSPHGTVRTSGCVLRPHANRCHGRPQGVASSTQCSWAWLGRTSKPLPQGPHRVASRHARVPTGWQSHAAPSSTLVR